MSSKAERKRAAATFYAGANAIMYVDQHWEAFAAWAEQYLPGETFTHSDRQQMLADAQRLAAMGDWVISGG